jgi:hypothetical protein
MDGVRQFSQLTRFAGKQQHPHRSSAGGDTNLDPERLTGADGERSTRMDDVTSEQPQPRERVGFRAWVRTVGLVGGGLMAGGILAGTLSANAATDDSSTTTPSVTQEQGTTTGGTTTDGTRAGDCPADGGATGSAPSATDPSA